MNWEDIILKERVIRLAHQVANNGDRLVMQFFDYDSTAMLNVKEHVLTELLSGKVPADIPQYYDILEKMPKEGIWD